MRIEFDPTNPEEAAAVRAMLTAMQPKEESHVRSNSDGSFSVEYRRDPTDGSVVFTSGTEGVNSLEETAAPTRIESEVDSDGTPWDARIHSTPPTTNKDGTWRAKRGVKAEEIATVRAEREFKEAVTEETERVASVGELPNGGLFVGTIKVGDTVMTATEEGIKLEAEQVAVSAPPAPPAPTGQSETPLAPATTETAPAETAPTTQSAPVAPSSPSFLDVMKAITAAQKDGKIDTAKVKELCAAVGAGESTMGLNGPDNGDKRGAFMALLASETGQ